MAVTSCEGDELMLRVSLGNTPMASWDRSEDAAVRPGTTPNIQGAFGSVYFKQGFVGVMRLRRQPVARPLGARQRISARNRCGSRSGTDKTMHEIA